MTFLSAFAFSLLGPDHRADLCIHAVREYIIALAQVAFCTLSLRRSLRKLVKRMWRRHRRWVVEQPEVAESIVFTSIRGSKPLYSYFVWAESRGADAKVERITWSEQDWIEQADSPIYAPPYPGG
jgi:hypothetical protein